jgi:hypothetical protein
MKEYTIKEIKEARNLLESKILGNIRVFEEETGLTIKDVNLIRILTFGNRESSLISVNLEIEIK